MRRELRWAVTAITALIVASTCAQLYARIASRYYAAVDRFIAIGNPWDILSVRVEPNDVGPGSVLLLVGDVRRHIGDSRAAARVLVRVQVGEAVETPLVFWTLLLLWPAVSARQRVVRCAVGLPIFLGLEAMTTAVQLLHSLPEASALLAGEQHPITWWEWWTRFLEGGGRFVVEVCAMLLTIAIAPQFQDKRAPGRRGVLRVPDPIHPPPILPRKSLLASLTPPWRRMS
jgi:hypothetical protein